MKQTPLKKIAVGQLRISKIDPFHKYLVVEEIPAGRYCLFGPHNDVDLSMTDVSNLIKPRLGETHKYWQVVIRLSEDRTAIKIRTDVFLMTYTSLEA